MTADFATGTIHPSWAKALAPVQTQLDALLADLARKAEQGQEFLPAPQHVLRAFQQPLEEVKVLVVGQDPYPTPGNSIGLAFSVARDNVLPASLRNIFKELHQDTGIVRTNGDLSGWAEQGVLLLNRVLTTVPGQPGSHRGIGWEEITQAAISALVEEGGPLVAILWGAQARNLKPILEGVPVIESVHPSPLSARRGFFGSKPFSRCNQLLEAQGATPIDWSA